MVAKEKVHPKMIAGEIPKAIDSLFGPYRAVKNGDIGAELSMFGPAGAFSWGRKHLFSGMVFSKTRKSIISTKQRGGKDPSKTPVILSSQPPRKSGCHNAGMTYMFVVRCSLFVVFSFFLMRLAFSVKRLGFTAAFDGSALKNQGIFN